MTIRYKCDACGAVMKIRDEKAGLQGHCPTCKAVFTVPQPGTAEAEAEESGVHAEATAAKTDKAAGKPGTDKPAAAPAKPASAEQPPAEEAPAGDSNGDDDDFDPVAFLTGDAPGGKAAAKSPGKPAGGKPPAASAKKAPAGKAGSSPAGPDDDDFDPVEFLMDGPAPSRPQPAAPPSPTPSRPGARKPATPPAPQGKPVAAAASASSAAEKAGALLKGGSNASSNAKELLSRSMDESRARSAEMPKEEKEGGIDWAGIGSELRRVGPKVLGGIVAIVAIYYGMDAMLGGGIDLPHLGRVSGTVTLDGKPLAGARVVFSSAERMVESRRGRQIKARAGTATTDEQGHYELIYLDNIKGAVVGRNRVQISKINEKGQEIIPLDYGTGSKVFRKVEEGYQEIDIDVKSQ
ncbi:MAG: carboxypeptidase-like regulatory domain-containing protein [Maioricimonas sp. JB045]|uniref:carboxypeptidase-like regulatory domain-containing protein n=1 Tax=Maioricimonas sp. JC845 TaxID=3232138 RepID=UPI0034582E43